MINQFLSRLSCSCKLYEAVKFCECIYEVQLSEPRWASQNSFFLSSSPWKKTEHTSAGGILFMTPRHTYMRMHISTHMYTQYALDAGIMINHNHLNAMHLSKRYPCYRNAEMTSSSLSLSLTYPLPLTRFVFGIKTIISQRVPPKID